MRTLLSLTATCTFNRSLEAAVDEVAVLLLQASPCENIVANGSDSHQANSNTASAGGASDTVKHHDGLLEGV